MHWQFNIVVILSCVVVACFMECWAALLHRLIWHTILWPIHKSHHQDRGDIAYHISHIKTSWEANDWLSMLHIPVAVALIVYGSTNPEHLHQAAALGAGFGMTCFGAAYLIIHDGLAHQRLPVRYLARLPYFKKVRNAHLLHHRTGGAPFGLFFGPWVVSSRKKSGVIG